MVFLKRAYSVSYSIGSSRHNFLGKTYLLRELRVHIKRIQAPIIAGLLLLMLILPQLALADTYFISFSLDSGRCGDLIEATANITVTGTYTYRICWNSRTPANVIETFTVTGAGNRTIAFYVPETAKGTYYVYLTREDYSELANDTFVVSPSVKIDPEEGPKDTAVTLNGYGFAASQGIQIKFKDTVITTATANTVGSWNATYTIPATPGGDYTFGIEFKEGTVWYDLLGKDFEVTPKITAPSSGTVGHTIEVSGTGFASEEEDIEVTFKGQSTDVEVVAKEDIPADQNGSWTAVIVVPPLRRGTYTIDASGESTRAGDVPDVEFILSAGILVEPSLAYVGDTITVAGGGFATGETGIKVTFDETVVASGIPADIDGCWESSFVLPASTFGSHTVSASGDITKPAVTTTLTTQARIAGPSPAEGAPGDSVTLAGNGFHGSQKLTVTIAGVAVSGNRFAQSNGNVVINFQVPKGSPEGKQALVVTDEGGATASVDFTVKKKTLSTTPLPISPKGSTLRSGMVTFHWQGIMSSSNITYTLEISETAAFTTNFRSESGIEESTYTLTEDEALPKGTYYWRVKIVDDYGNESAWSSPSSFTVSPIPTWVWVVVGVVVLVVLMVVAYRETKFRVTE